MKNKAVRAIKTFSGIANPRTWGPLVETFEYTKFDHAFDISWSQGGEDIGLISALKGINNGRYVDVGAHDPSRFSVTRKLSIKGWSGVNIDGNPDLIPPFEKNRPKDINLWACVGSEAEYTFTIFEEPAISTANSEWREKFIGENQKIKKAIKVPGISLRTVFERYFDGGFPDLLCIDAEGADLDVLKSANLMRASGPEWLLLEADPPLSTVIETPAVAYALSLGYEIHLVMGMSTLLHMKS
jgi:FkbM family methyltransferase